MRVVVVAAILSTVLLSSTSHSQPPALTKTIIDDGANGPGGIAIGRPYCPGSPILKRLYCVGINMDLAEYRYDVPTSQWVKQVILAGVDYDGVTIGPGRNATCERMYCTNHNQLYEVWYEGGTWHNNLLLELPDRQWIYVVIGPGRNDGVNRVYATSNDPKIYEFTYVGPGPSNWDIQVIDLNMSCQDIGAGQNDGISRIYGNGGQLEELNIYELSYEGAWVRRLVHTWDWGSDDPVPAQLLGVTLAAARDEQTRLYYQDMYCGVNELSYESGIWINRPVETNRPFEYAYGTGFAAWQGPFACGSIWKDDVGPPMHLFIGGEDKLQTPEQVPDGHAFVFGYEAATESWSTYHIGGVGKWGVEVIIGDVRMLGDYALYAVSMDGQLVEFYDDD